MNKQNKKEKKTFKKVFTEPGQPGEMMRPLFDQMVEKLRIPNNLREVCHNHQLKNLHGDFAFVLPSFYQSVMCSLLPYDYIFNCVSMLLLD